jgi:hypothetical protein
MGASSRIEVEEPFGGSVDPAASRNAPGVTRGLRDNIASLTKPPLPTSDRQQIVTLFSHLVGVGIEAPKHVQPTPARRQP